MTRYRRDTNRIRKVIDHDMAHQHDPAEWVLTPPEPQGDRVSLSPLTKVPMRFFDEYYDQACQRGTTRLSRERAEFELNQLMYFVNVWDPAGLIDLGSPEDVYEGVVLHIMQLLENGATARDLAAGMETYLRKHFGDSVKNRGDNYFPTMVSWYHACWNESVETYSGDYLEMAHSKCFDNRADLMASRECSCFHCLKTFSPGEIWLWMDAGESTAVCPHCMVDSLLAETSGFPRDDHFLRVMRMFWFGEPYFLVKRPPVMVWLEPPADNEEEA